MLTRWRRTLGGTVSIIVLVAGFASVSALVSPASAEKPTCTPPAVLTYSGGTYTCEIPGDQGPTQPPGDDDDGPTAPPPCDLANRGPSGYEDKNPTPNFCIGKDVCFTIDLFPPLAMPKGPKPKPTSKARVTMCYDGIMGPPAPGEVFWSDDEPTPTLLQQAQTAIGQIKLGNATVGASPQTRTVVKLPTWFWLEGAQRRATGSSAFGLVAIATFQSMEVDPGDGSGSFSCPVTTTEDEAADHCSHVYVHSSAYGTQQVGGRAAFGVRITTVYGLRFEVNGTPTTIPGAPTTLDGPTANSAIRVDEVQSKVTRVY